MPSPDAGRPAAVQHALRQVERRWGLQASGRLFGVTPPLASLSTGIPELDRATGFDGIPQGRVSEITGPAASGALTLGLRALAAALDTGGLAACIDLPGTFSPIAGVALGLDLLRLVVVRPPDADTALRAAATLLRSDGFEALLLDLGDARPRANRFAHLADLAGRGGTGVVVVTEHVGPRITGLPYLASLRLGVACRGWRWRRSGLGQLPVGLILDVHILKTRRAMAIQRLTVDCPFLGRRHGPRDDLHLDPALPDRPGSLREPSLVGAAPRDLRAAV